MKFNKPLSATQGLALVVSIGALVNYLVFQATQDYAGPITAALLLLLCSSVIRLNGSSWKELGLKKVDRPLRLLWQVPLVMVVTIAVGALGTKLLLMVFEAPVPSQSRFEGIEGNLIMFIQWSLIGWIVGGFMEEMIFRGFLLNQFAKLFRNHRMANFLAVLCQAFLFGAIHFYNRGIVGGLSIFMVSIALGLFYLRFNKNLWPLIIAHGIIDTLSFLEDFLGA